MKDQNKAPQMIDEKDLIDIWYAGLGEAFRRTRGPLATAACHDRPQYREIYYGAVGFVLLFMGICALMAAALMTHMLWIALLCALTGVITLFQTLLFFRALWRLKKAVADGKDADRNDPLRLKVMSRALKWGIRTGWVVRDMEGRYVIRP